MVTFPQTILSRPLEKGYVQCTACVHWCAVALGAAANVACAVIVQLGHEPRICQICGASVAAVRV